MAEACNKVPELVVLVELLIAHKIHHIAARFHMAQEEAMKAQWVLNLQIAYLSLKEQPPTPLEIREKHHGEIQ